MPSKWKRQILALFTLLISIFMILTPLSVFPANAVTCAGGLNPRLHFTLLVPTSNPARRAWAAIVQNSLQCVGFDVSRQEFPFSPDIFARALAPPPNIVGKTYDQGGFDILFVGYNLIIDPDPFQIYDSSQFSSLGGQNYYLWNNTQNDQLGRQIDATLDHDARLNLVKQWQQLAYDQLPSIPLLYTHEIVAFDSDYSNAQSVFNAYHAPAWPPIEHLANSTTSSKFILAQTGQAPGEGVVPELSTSYYDLAISGEIFSPLALRNDTIFKTMIPDLAKGTPTVPGWSVSPDNKTWTVNIRPGVNWQDGQPFSATDVKFTYDVYQNATLGSNTAALVQSVIGGKNNVVVTNSTQVVFHLPKPYAYFVQNILSVAELPAHLLNQTAFYSQLGGKIDYSKIGNSLFNRPDIGVGGVLPVGTGPYVWSGWDSATTTAHLVKNTNYYDFNDWGKSALLAKNQFGVKDYYVKFILGSDAAITALSNHEVDYLDGQYHLETQQNFLTSWGSSRETDYDAFGVQEMGVNMMHPILGTGTGTPYAQQYPGNLTAAANAAKWIRQAISYATPRTQIVTGLLNGAGVEAITTPIVGNWHTGQSVMEGFNTALQPYPYDLAKAAQLLQQAGYTQIAAPASFFDLYGIYLVSAVVIAAVAVAAIYLLRVRGRPMQTQSSTTTSTPLPPTTTPP
jgi:ABC-type transport system substrate-binding protein